MTNDTRVRLIGYYYLMGLLCNLKKCLKLKKYFKQNYLTEIFPCNEVDKLNTVLDCIKLLQL